MKSFRTVLILSWAIAAIGCAPSISVKEDFDVEADFAALHTYDWVHVPTDAAGSVQAALARNSLLDKRIKASVNGELSKKGYTENAESPDFLVLYHTGAESKVDVTDWGYGYGRYYGGGGIDVYQYTEGTLILDIIDAKSKQLVWRGMAQGTIDPDSPPERREQRLNEAVMRMLANFPPPPR
ncbi:MAG: DUF4136 domain-containing protein [bacterium]